MDNKKTVLLIEDERDLLQLYSDILSEAGFNVISADDGISGTTMVREKHWDLLLLDIMLPDKDGMVILEEMADNPDLKKGSVIILTNLNDENLIKKGLALGASGYLIKSEVTLDYIVEEVKKYI